MHTDMHLRPEARFSIYESIQVATLTYGQELFSREGGLHLKGR